MEAFLNPSEPANTPYIWVNQMTIEGVEVAHRLACLEVRGGNHLAAYTVELPGLTGWVSCHPLQLSPGGGDVYYMTACSQGVMARVALADVSGHGEAVSAAAGRLRDALRQHVEQWDQSTLIRQLNDTFLKGARRSQFATAFVASYYSESGELLFTNAGHVPPLWYRAGAQEWSFLSDSTPLSKEIVDLPLGLIAGTSYTQTAVQLEPGDLLLLYTDGVNEAYDESGTQLGLERLLSIARSLPTESATAAGKELLASVARFRGTASTRDDETVLALQRRPAWK
ncbi:MAG TPA: PP2C family protein-serine/threonine phosphatase [Bryobacteraceae bacterium]|jgi:sigma-B regulation protein RsbU (phosphoserine phosphatase)|nr:PP2C family protein-serine/threonine phosphatase [Bryobacteraceae bacterium]